MNRSGLAFVLASTVLWGTIGTAASYISGASTLAIGAATMGFGGVIQAGLAIPAIRRSWGTLKRQWRWVLLGGINLFLFPLGFFGSMHLAGVAIGTVVSIGLCPLFAAIAQRLFDKTKLAGRWGVAASIGLVGVGLLAFAGEGTASAHSTGQTIGGVGLGLLAAATFGFYSWVAGKVMARGLSARATVGACFGVSGLMLLPIALVNGAPLVADWNNALWIAYLIVVCQVIAHRSYGAGLARLSSVNATTITMAEPVIAATLAVLVLHERLPLFSWAGAALVVVCLVILSTGSQGDTTAPA
ncbi:MAG: DMT family transporter [Micrococcales bacterium]|nr:DMT family transporter [Micrococcales bacterium]